MKPTIEAEEDENGNSGPDASETVLLSEESLAADWNRREEDAAWAGLEPA